MRGVLVCLAILYLQPALKKSAFSDHSFHQICPIAPFSSFSAHAALVLLEAKQSYSPQDHIATSVLLRDRSETVLLDASFLLRYRAILSSSIFFFYRINHYDITYSSFIASSILHNYSLCFFYLLVIDSLLCMHS